MLRPLRVLSVFTLVAFLTSCGGDVHDRVNVRPERVRPRVTETHRTIIDYTPLVRWLSVAKWNDTVARNAASAREVRRPPYRHVDLPPNLQPCGGDLPPCWRVQIESHGDYGAFNPGGCGGRSCYGKYQFSGEWACKLGLPCDLTTATPEQQDAAARLLWRGGAGCSNWSAC